VIQQAKGIPFCNFEPRTSLKQRQKKLEQIQALGHDPYPREFRWTDYAGRTGRKIRDCERAGTGGQQA